MSFTINRRTFLGWTGLVVGGVAVKGHGKPTPSPTPSPSPVFVLSPVAAGYGGGTFGQTVFAR